MFKIRLRNVANELARVKAEFEKISGNHQDIVSNNLLNDMVEATPIDTGKARASWSLVKVNNNRRRLINTTDYIQRLNQGSSKQAPANFVESVALKHGTPTGIIVDVK